MEYQVSVEFQEPAFLEESYNELMELLGKTEISEVFIDCPIIGYFSVEEEEEEEEEEEKDGGGLLDMCKNEVLGCLLEEKSISENDRKVVEFLLKHIKDIPFHLVIED
ncbi:MAG: hypothetical protein ACRCT1_12475 [Microcoleaceae cyanobacterium]